MAHGIVLQTQADAPPGLLGEWAAKRGIALETVRVDEADAYPDPRDPDFVVALGSGRHRRRRRAGVGRGGDRVAARGRRRRAPGPRHLLRRPGAGRRARRLRAQAGDARARLDHRRDQRRRPRPRRAVDGLARGSLHARRRWPTSSRATRSACRRSATAGTSRCSSIRRSRRRSSRDWTVNDHGDLGARRHHASRRWTPPRAATRPPPRELPTGCSTASPPARGSWL